MSGRPLPRDLSTYEACQETLRWYEDKLRATELSNASLQAERDEAVEKVRSAVYLGIEFAHRYPDRHAKRFVEQLRQLLEPQTGEER